MKIRVLIPIFSTFILYLLLSLIPARADTTVNGNVVCSQQYALCTSAPCVRISGSQDKVMCFCKVEEGKSLGKTSCDARKPMIDKDGAHKIISTFSLAEFATKKVLTCPGGTPWANCLDMPCVIDPTDPTKTVCTCKVIKNGAYVTLGGGCDEASCNQIIMSGAAPDSNAEYVKIMARITGLSQVPQNQCVMNPSLTRLNR